MHITAIRKTLFFAAILALMEGCAGLEPATPTYDDGGVLTKIPAKTTYIDTDTGNTVIEKHTVYTPDVDLKSAVIILIKKVDALEKKIYGSGGVSRKKSKKRNSK